jgi:hypothetical protein
MVECKECGRKLGIFEGYRHPLMGKKHLLCSNCFDTVSKSVEQWNRLVLSYADFFNNETSNNSFQFEFKNLFSNFNTKRKMFFNFD